MQQNIPTKVSAHFQMALCAVLLICLSACKADVPDTISFEIGRPIDVKAFMNVDVNDHAFERYRPSGVNITMPYPPFSDDDPKMYVQISWLDVYSGESYKTKTIEIDPKKLSHWGPSDPDWVDLQIELGRKGQVTVQTSQQEYLDLIDQNLPKQITPELRTPIVLEQFCAEEWVMSAEEKEVFQEQINMRSKHIKEIWAYAKTQPQSETICE